MFFSRNAKTEQTPTKAPQDTTIACPCCGSKTYLEDVDGSKVYVHNG
jgi:hypothetical protein